MRHEDAWKRLPDLLDDRDDPALLAHVRVCADCQRQLFLLGRIDRLLRESASEHGRARMRPNLWRPLAAAATIAAVAAAAALLAFVVPHQARTQKFMLRTALGQLVGEAKMGDSDGRNVSLALVAHSLPVNRGHIFVLWAGDERSSMQVGRFMVDQSGGCRVSFNLPATHSWRRLWVTEPGNPRLVAST